MYPNEAEWLLVSAENSMIDTEVESDVYDLHNQPLIVAKKVPTHGRQPRCLKSAVRVFLLG